MKKEVTFRSPRKRIFQSILIVLLVVLLVDFLQTDLKDIVAAFLEGYNDARK